MEAQHKQEVCEKVGKQFEWAAKYKKIKETEQKTQVSNAQESVQNSQR